MWDYLNVYLFYFFYATLSRHFLASLFADLKNSVHEDRRDVRSDNQEHFCLHHIYTCLCVCCSKVCQNAHDTFQKYIFQDIFPILDAIMKLL